MTTKPKSSQAQVAALCKKFCKDHGIKATARSSGYSMGDSVTVTVQDQAPEVMDMLESEFAKYEYGHFDGMNDIYELSNRRDDIPQTKYLFINNNISDETKQAAWDFLRSKFPGNAADKPADYSEARDQQWSCDHFEYHDQIQMRVQDVLGGRGILDNSESVEFWDSLEN